jgi:hypothetical protein
VCFGLGSAALTAAPPKSAKEERVKDLSRRVEVVTAGRLRPSADGLAKVDVSLWNPNEFEIKGPIIVVVDGSGIDGVQAANHAEQTAEGKALYEVVPAGQALVSHGMTASFPMVFETPAGFTQEQANEFELSVRVFAREGKLSARSLPDARSRRQRDAGKVLQPGAPRQGDFDSGETHSGTAGEAGRDRDGRG